VEIKTKQRMIGTVIIIIILLILVPLLFSKSKQPNNETTAEQTPAIETSSEVNPEQQAMPAEQPEISVDQSQPAIAEHPEAGTTIEPSAPQDGSQLSAPVTGNEQPKPEENVVTPPSNPVAIPATDNQPSVPKIITPIKVAATTTETKNWSVQLGVFSKKNNATQLVNKLKAGNFDVHMKELSASNGKSYRVFVGNNYDRNKAQKVAYNLNKIYHLEGVVVNN
jgi:cell division septation protein DedD